MDKPAYLLLEIIPAWNNANNACFKHFKIPFRKRFTQRSHWNCSSRMQGRWKKFRAQGTPQTRVPCWFSLIRWQEMKDLGWSLLCQSRPIMFLTSLRSTVCVSLELMDFTKRPFWSMMLHNFQAFWKKKMTCNFFIKYFISKRVKEHLERLST